jgi:hypothetical protein
MGSPHEAIDNMALRAYNLEFVTPVILEDFLLPNQLVEKNDDRVRITSYGRKILDQINQPGVLPDDIMDVIEVSYNDDTKDSNTIRSLDLII